MIVGSWLRRGHLLSIVHKYTNYKPKKHTRYIHRTRVIVRAVVSKRVDIVERQRSGFGRCETGLRVGSQRRSLPTGTSKMGIIVQ
jgi:hypothetical protein